MTTRNFQTDITTEIFSADGDKSISISQLGITLKRNILTTPIETIITPLDITDVNTGNVITMDKLTYLPTGLAALDAPPNLTTLKVVDTILIDGTGILGNDTNTVNNSSMSIFNVDTGNTYNIGKNSNDLVIDAGGDRLLLNANNNEFYIGEYTTGTAPVINSSGSSTKTLFLNSRDGITKIGDTDNNHFSTRILIDDAAGNMELNSLGTITIGDCALASGQEYINLDTNNATITINAPGGCDVKDTILIDKTGNLNSNTVAFDRIILTDGTTTNTINKTGYSTKNTVANSTHYLNFSDFSSSGIGPIQKTAGISCNPATNIITATTFVGASTNLVVTSDNTSGTYYIPFVKTSGTGDKSVYMDDAIGPLTYNPNTATLSTSILTLNSVPSTATVASRFGQVGLVKLQTINTTITGSASTQSFNLTSIFTSAYKNYRIILQPRSDVTFTAYPAYNLSAFLGTGTLPTLANLYGYEMTSSSVNLQSLFTNNIVIASTPVIFAVTGLTNKVVSFDITNVGYTTASSTVINMNCKSFYNNPGVNGVSDRNIQIAATSGSTITGLTFQQTSIGLGNNFDLSAIIYGYNQL